ncbi:MAG: LemA family protein [Fimbriimonas sp.]
MMFAILGIGIALVIGLAMIYNSLVAMRRLTENAWADVDVYLQRRAQLVPNLVETVKGAAAFESNTLEKVVSARSEAAALHQPTASKALAESELASGVSRMLMVAESYPVLQANQSFLGLQRELSETERLIASARQYYNACVRDYNTLIESFPQAIVAGAMGLKPKDFFEIEDLTERAAPGVGL